MSKATKIVIFDIDGTLADSSKRVHYILPKDGGKKNWKAFMDEAKYDEPHPHVVSLNKMYFNAGYHVVLLTGREASRRQDTLDWLNKEGVIFHALIMRLTSDYGKDNLVKKALLESYLEANNFDASQIEVLYEDRLHVAETWREMGLPVFLVGDEWRNPEVKEEV